MKLILKLVAALVVLILIVAIAIPMFISADYLKAQLQQQVKASTGRDLTIKGKVSIKALPNIAIVVEDVTFGNPAGFSTPYLVKIGKLDVGAALMPMLHKELRVTGITLDKADLYLEENGAGAKNWDFAKKATAADTSAPTPAEKSSGASPLVIDAITIKNSAVHYRKGAMKLDTTDIDTHIAIDPSKTKITLNHASLYEGSAKADVVLSTKPMNPSKAMSLVATFDGIQIEPMVTALTGASKMKGTTSLKLNVTGGGEGDAMMRSLNGTGDITIKDGAIKGIDIAGFLRNVKSGFTLGNSPSQSTDFTELTATTKISNGIVMNDDLAMKSPVLRLSGKGEVNLPAKTINYRAVPAIVGTIEGQGGKDAKGLNIPLNITGPWSAIQVQPDLAGMLQEGLKDPEALKQNLKDIKGSLKDYNSPKDIGKALFGGKPVEQPAATPAPSSEAAPATSAPAVPAEQKKPKLGDLLGGFGKKQ